MDFSDKEYSKEQHPSRGYRQGRLFDPKDYYSKDQREYPRNYKQGSSDDAIDAIKTYAHELGMIKDLLTAVLNRVDAIEERIEMQTEVIEEIADTLLEP